MTQSRVVLCDVDYVLLRPADPLDTMQWFARRELLNPDRIVAAVEELAVETGLGRYSSTQEWLVAVLEAAEAEIPPAGRLLQMTRRLVEASVRRLTPYPGIERLRQLSQTRDWPRGIVSGKGFISRDASLQHLPGFDRYGFSCDHWRWNKDINPHAFADMARQLVSGPVDLSRVAVLEDNYHYGIQAKHDGVGLVVIVLHHGGKAAQDLAAGTTTRSELMAQGLVLTDSLLGAVDYLELLD